MANLPHKIHTFSSPPESLYLRVEVQSWPLVQVQHGLKQVVLWAGAGREAGWGNHGLLPSCFLFVQFSLGFVSERMKQSCALWVQQRRMQLYRHQVTKGSFYCFSLFPLDPHPALLLRELPSAPESKGCNLSDCAPSSAHTCGLCPCHVSGDICYLGGQFFSLDWIQFCVPGLRIVLESSKSVRILMGAGQAAREGILQPWQTPPPLLGPFVISGLGTGSSVGLSAPLWTLKADLYLGSACVTLRCCTQSERAVTSYWVLAKARHPVHSGCYCTGVTWPCPVMSWSE